VLPAPWSEFADELEIAVGEAMQLRPELGVLSSQRQVAAEGIEIARSGKRIQADAVAAYNVFTRDFRVGSEAYFLGLIAKLNLFDGGRTEYDVERAAARLRELRAREQRLMLDIELDVRRSHLQLVDARQRLEVATQAIAQAGESLREIEVRYRGQAATITELIDAQVALSNARVRRANAESDVEIARAALQRAIGRLSTAL
jgi:outer membrane protein TolC